MEIKMSRVSKTNIFPQRKTLLLSLPLDFELDVVWTFSLNVLPNLTLFVSCWNFKLWGNVVVVFACKAVSGCGDNLAIELKGECNGKYCAIKRPF